MPYQDLSVGSTANKPKSEPSFLDKVKDFFSGGDDTPSSSSQAVSGGRGRVVERPNERNDYLAKILSDNAVVPPPSAADVLVSQRTNAGYVNPTNLDSGLRFVPNSPPDYSGNVDRYSIPVGQYFPESIGAANQLLPPNLKVNPRAVADYLGLTDLANINPVTTMFVRPRDAAARYGDPETYSPTGQRETSDLFEAALGPLEAVIGLGAGRLVREPLEKGLGSLFGFDTDISGPNRSDENLRLYHGTPRDAFTPQQKVRMPDGSIQYIDMFQVAGGRPGDMSTLQSLAPEGAEVLETYPYGRLTTEFIGTGEGGFEKGSLQAQEDPKGALGGKGIYMGSNPNISQYYRYTDSYGIPFVPYKDSRKDGIGQVSLKPIQDAIKDEYGSLENARQYYQTTGFSVNINGEEVFFESPRVIEANAQVEFQNVLEEINLDENLSKYIEEDDPDTFIPDILKEPESKVNQAIENMASRMDEIRDSGVLDKQVKSMPIEGEPKSITDEIELLRDSGFSESEIKDVQEYYDLQSSVYQYRLKSREIRLEKQNRLQNENKDIQSILYRDVDDIPGSLFFADLPEAEIGKYLDLGDPRKSFYFSPKREISGEIDIGTLNDMIDIFGTEWVEKRLAGLPTDRAWQIVGDDPVSRLEKTGNPNLPYRIQDSSQSGRSVVASENVFKPRTVEEMRKLAEAGYTNLRFLDATSRRDGDNPSYNYVFFGDDVMPKIVDKKKDGGVIGMGLGSV